MAIKKNVNNPMNIDIWDAVYKGDFIKGTWWPENLAGICLAHFVNFWKLMTENLWSEIWCPGFDCFILLLLRHPSPKKGVNIQFKESAI